MDLREAITKHAEWKVKFRAAIARKEQLDAATIGRDNCCNLGQWLHGGGRMTHGRKPEFTAVIEKHRVFHTEAGRVARLINDRRYEQAERELGLGTPFTTASTTVGTAIQMLIAAR